MALLVVDASLALAWCFEDEATGWADGVLERLRHGDRMIVPAHWPTEVLNGLLVALRRKRIGSEQPAQFWDQLVLLPIEIEPPLATPQAKAILALGEKYNLTIYDAAYLDLANRRGLPLGTLDAELRRAAELQGVPSV
jgi:predicted nucleic acid-binding protein